MTVNALQKIINDLCFDKSTEIDKLAEEFMKVYVDAHFDKSIDKFSEESNLYSNQLEALRGYLQIDDVEDYKKIYYFAMIETIKNLSDTIAMLDIPKAEDYSGFKYVYPILEVLYHNGTMPVVCLADRLNIERHSLTNAIRRADKFGLWSQKKVGRNSLYQITAKGEQAYTAYIKNKVVDDRHSLDKVVSVLLSNIEQRMTVSQPDINEIVREINRQIQCSGFSSSMLKIKILKIFSKRDEYVKENAKEYIGKYNALKKEYLNGGKYAQINRFGKFHEDYEEKEYWDGYDLSPDFDWGDYSEIISEVD